MIKFELSLANDKIWQIKKLIGFLTKYSNQDIFLSVIPEAHDLDFCGLYDILDCFNFRSVTIETSNCLEKHNKYQIVYRPVDEFLKKTYWKNYNLASSGIWNQSKIFGAFYGRATANRIGIASHLLAHHDKQSIVIFAADIDNANDRQLFEVDKLFQYRPESIVDFSDMISRRYHQNLSYTGYGGDYDPHTRLHDCYRSILIDIISEPNIEGVTFYPTEKFSRCVLMKKPFIAMTSMNYLEYLRQMGFRSFNHYWNEDYDGFSAENRHGKILKLIDDIANRSESELISMYHDMADTLEHNYKVLTDQIYNTSITEVI